jgi:hypothetical protein
VHSAAQKRWGTYMHYPNGTITSIVKGKRKGEEEKSIKI